MDILTLLLIAIGLAMDVFAVSLGVGIQFKKPTFRQIFRLSFHSGLFQALMPIIGWSAGLGVEKLVEAYDHWVAFGLLAFIGGKMIYESSRNDREALSSDPTKGMTLIILSIATSIDALAVGFSLALLKINIWFPSVIIGIVAMVMSIIGILLGKRVGVLFGRRVSMVGGLILFIIGFKILFEHLTR